MALTDEAINKIKELIQSGELGPGSRLPPELQLSAQLGLSRSSMREAIKALEMARVIDVRRGDGTYVTSLAPRLLLKGLGFAIDLVQDDNLLEVMEVRRLLEPAATALAATRISADHLAELGDLLAQMRAAAQDAEKLIQFDTEFHRVVIAAAGNDTLLSILEGLSGRTVRARVWRGMVEGDVSSTTIAEHDAIYQALLAGHESLAHATALVHVNTSESWLRRVLAEPPAPAG